MSTATARVNHPIHAEHVQPGDIVTWPKAKADHYASQRAALNKADGMPGEVQPFVTILSAEEIARLPKPKVDDPASMKAPTGDEFQAMLQSSKDKARGR